ncbi:MAG: heavy-metal-associated domain-containing protein [Burkholderiaceae bacterium]|nr:heavy-metal-associated domain-containing protein [Burkholderiaceae bacterium]
MISLQVKGMSCGHCVRAVEQAIRDMDADAGVNVDLGSGKVDVDSTKLGREQLVAAITEEGYEVTG